MSIIRNSNNPQDMLQSMAANNPNVQGIMSLINKYNGDPKAAFFALAKERGVDPTQFLSTLNIS